MLEKLCSELDHYAHKPDYDYSQDIEAETFESFAFSDVTPTCTNDPYKVKIYIPTLYEIYDQFRGACAYYSAQRTVIGRKQANP